MAIHSFPNSFNEISVAPQHSTHLIIKHGQKILIETAEFKSSARKIPEQSRAEQSRYDRFQPPSPAYDYLCIHSSVLCRLSLSSSSATATRFFQGRRWTYSARQGAFSICCHFWVILRLLLCHGFFSSSANSSSSLVHGNEYFCWRFAGSHDELRRDA